MVEEGIRSTLMLPLLAGEEAVGFFFLDNRTPGAYTERDVELLDPVAQQLALAIQNNRLLKELQEQSRELARIGGGNESLAGGRPGRQLDPGSADRAHHHCRPCRSTLGDGRRNDP